MQQAGAGLTKIVRDALRRAPANEVPVLAWPLVCGAAVAQKTQAVGFENGVLRVAVPDANWRAQLRELAPQYMTGMQAMAGIKLERIEFEIAPAKPSAVAK